jgi:hypothetical protein
MTPSIVPMFVLAEDTGPLLAVGIPLALTCIVAVELPVIFYILTLVKALRRCSPETRRMRSGWVWLLLIPLLDVVFHFFIVREVSGSLGAELRRRDPNSYGNPGQGVGMATCILGVVAVVPFPPSAVPAAIAGFICWIIYWSKIARASARIARPFAGTEKHASHAGNRA